MTGTTREKIIIATQNLIQERKEVDLKLAEIADQVGITHGAIYKHFKNKQELLTAVAKNWFDTAIIQQIKVEENKKSAKEVLHEWLWQFVNAKKNAYNNNPGMFELNATYVETNPVVLRTVLQESIQMISNLMAYKKGHQKAEAILAVFAVFTLPSFSSTWNLPDYQERFEQLWQLIESGL